MQMRIEVNALFDITRFNVFIVILNNGLSFAFVFTCKTKAVVINYQQRDGMETNKHGRIKK